MAKRRRCIAPLGKPLGLLPGHRSTIPPISINSWWSSLPPVSRSLYKKAAAENDSLTSAERLYLLSLLDLPGKALAHPDSLTEGQRDLLLGRPPPKLMASNIRRLFPTSKPKPADKDSHGQRIEGRTGKRQLGTVAEVVDAFQDSTQLVTLSYKALECIALGWWPIHQERAPAPWEDWENLKMDDAGEAADALLRRIRSGETAFEDAARDLWLRPGTMEFRTAAFQESEADDEDLLSMHEMVDQYATEASRLREELRVEVAAKLASLSEEDKTALEELRERMLVEVARDAEEDARRPEIEAEERKRKAEEEVEEKRRIRALKKQRVEDDEGDEDESDEAGYHLTSLVLTE